LTDALHENQYDIEQGHFSCKKSLPYLFSRMHGNYCAHAIGMLHDEVAAILSDRMKADSCWALTTTSASTGINFNNLHSYRATNGAAAFRLQMEQNGLPDPAHQIVKALGMCVTAGKLWNRGNVIIIIIPSDHDM